MLDQEATADGETKSIDIKRLKDLRQRPKLYGMFCCHFLKCVIGENQWKTNYLKKPLSDYVTVSDEAFAFLVVENSLDRWTDMWVKNNKKTSSVPALYTNAGVSAKDGRTKRYCGWSAEGIARFNLINDAVRKNRLQFPDFEKELLVEWQTKKKVTKVQASVRRRWVDQLSRQRQTFLGT